MKVTVNRELYQGAPMYRIAIAVDDETCISWLVDCMTIIEALAIAEVRVGEWFIEQNGPAAVEALYRRDNP